jgi:glucose/arabinose dehydrogenase
MHVKMNLRKPVLVAALAIAAFTADRGHAWTYSSPTAVGNCGNLDEAGTASDFTTTSIVNKALFPGVSDVLKMAFVMPSETAVNADVIFIERFGAVKYYNAAAKTLTLIGTVTGLSIATEDGLVGVAVERPFKNRVYVAYSRSVATNPSNQIISGSFRLSRFTMNATTRMMDMASEKVLLDVPSARNRWHTAGAMQFDKAGNLYWAVGDNEMAFTGPGNTHDLRGSIVRIHPNEDGNGYTIPPGNFAEVWSNKFMAQGRTTLANKYLDTSKVRPEIYIKGTRNTYSISVDPNRQQVVYGQCGPDYGGMTELHSNSLAPNFAGWPFWSGTTSVAPTQMGSAQYGKNKTSEPTEATWPTFLPANKENPVNTFTATMAGAPGPGVDTLPPFTPAKYTYNRSCAMGSVIIHYDGRVANPGKLPPQMNNVWLMGDYQTRKLRPAKVDSNGNIVGTVNVTPGIFTTGGATVNGIGGLVDMQQGPDGALYVANLNCNGGVMSGENHYSDACTGIVRIEYKGAACSDTALHPVDYTTGFGRRPQVERGVVDWVQLGAAKFSVLTEGLHSIRISDVQGRVLASSQGEGRKEYDFPGNLTPNAAYFLEVKSARGVNVRGFILK